MSRISSLSLAAMSAIAVMVVSSGVASAQQGSWNPYISDNVVYGSDGGILKVRGRRGRGRRGRSRGRGYRGRRGGNEAGALLGGLIIGGIIADQAHRRNYRGNYERPRNAHLDWCYNRYRSYRSYDNTFQPYNGPRRPCISPYY